MCVGRAILRGINSSTKTIHQTVVDPRWIIPARSKRQHLIATAAVSFIIDGTFYGERTGVAETGCVACIAQLAHNLVDCDAAEFDCGVRNCRLC